MVSRCVGETTNTRNVLTVTTVTAALQGLGRRAAQAGRGRPGAVSGLPPEGRGVEGERYLPGANAKASYKLSICKVGRVLYMQLSTNPCHLSTRE